MSYFSKNYNLVCVHKDLEKPEENSPLWTVQLFILEMINGKNVVEREKNLNKFYSDCHIGGGLYNQRPVNNGSHEDYMSHDQLSAMFCFFYLTNQIDKCIAIHDEIERQGGHYDNVNPTDPDRLVHPRDGMFFAILLDREKFYFMFLFKLITWETCHKKYKIRPTLFFRIKYFFKEKKFYEGHVRKIKVTDGKLITFVRCLSALSHKREFSSIYRLATKTLIKNPIFGSWLTVFNMYFGKNLVDHPTKNLVQQTNFEDAANTMFINLEKRKHDDEI